MAPVPLSMPDPDFSEPARKKKLNGTVAIALVVDTEGNPREVHVVHSLADDCGKKERKAALSLDDVAVKAVKQYHFKPATLEGKPVPVTMQVEIRFALF